MTRCSILAAVAALVLMGAYTAALAEDSGGWRDEAELSFVATDGNSESSSLGFKNKLWREWEKSTVVFNAGAVRVETTTFSRTTSDGVSVEEMEFTETTAEKYFANVRYGREITERFFWYTGAGWDRNEPAGIKNRYIGEGGVGNTWFDRDDMKFRTAYAVTYTDQEDVVEDRDFDDTFLGARFSWDYMNQLGANTTYTNVLILDDNLDETSDWRADMTNGLAVAMSERLALKVGLQLLYDNEPAVDLAPSVTPGVDPAPFELDDLDTILTVSLVVNFK